MQCVDALTGGEGKARSKTEEAAWQQAVSSDITIGFRKASEPASRFALLHFDILFRAQLNHTSKVHLTCILPLNLVLRQLIVTLP